MSRASASGRGLLEWNSFYSRVRPVLDHVVVADFATVTTDYSVVIDEVNRRFGTGFTPIATVLRPTRRCSRRSKRDAVEGQDRIAARDPGTAPLEGAGRAQDRARSPSSTDPEIRALVEPAESLYSEYLAVAARPS